MNMSEIAGLVAGLDVEIGDAELPGSDAELLDSLRRERTALIRDGLALEESEAEEAFALDRASDRAFSPALQADERRAVEPAVPPAVDRTVVALLRAEERERRILRTEFTDICCDGLDENGA